MADPITAAGNNVSKAMIDLNEDKLPDSVEVVWEQQLKTKKKKREMVWEPVVTARIDAPLANGQDEYVLVGAFDFMNDCREKVQKKVIQKGDTIPDTSKKPGAVDRIVTGFSVEAKKEPNPKTGIPEYALGLYMNLMPEKTDNSHRQSSRIICGPFFNPALFQGDPNREPARSPVASKHY